MGTGNCSIEVQNGLVHLYSPQAEAVWDAVHNDGAAFSRREYVETKYQESAGIFLAAYDAYVREAEKIVHRPEPRAYPYWAFAARDMADTSGGSRIMELAVPAEQAVFFDVYDWYRVLRLSYIGETEADEAAFSRKIQLRGIRDTSDAVLKPFYPDIKREITDSWKRLFRHDTNVRAAAGSGYVSNGEARGGMHEDGRLPWSKAEVTGVRAVQAGLWCIRKEWLI